MTYWLLADLAHLFEIEASESNSGAEYCRLLDISIEIKDRAMAALERELTPDQ